MPTLYQPLIRRADYDAFRTVLGNELPRSFGTWLHVRHEQAMRALVSGHDLADVELCPESFAMHCAVMLRRPTLQTLWRYARATARPPLTTLLRGRRPADRLARRRTIRDRLAFCRGLGGFLDRPHGNHWPM